MPRLRTLCSGGELFGVGAAAAGYTHVDGYEIEDKIAAIARRNGFAVRTADVTTVDYRDLGQADHLHGSPSCRTASVANLNAGETADDLAVADAFCRAIRAHAAQGGRSFSLENVIGYRWYDSYDRICATLRACGFVFETVIKGGKRPAWRVDAPLFHDAGVFVDAADFGVPQNRKRLILRAVASSWRQRVPGLRPTHGKRGGILLAPWRGWFGAIEDLVDTLKPTRPARWQMLRLPAELRESLLVHSTDMRSMPTRTADESAFTVMAGSFKDSHQPGGKPRAYLCGGGNSNLDDPTSHARAEAMPAFTLRDGRNGSPERALLLAGAKSPSGDGLIWRGGDAPSTTVVAAEGGRIVSRAWLLDGDNARAESGEPTYRSADQPAMALRGTRTPAHRGLVAGRWVLMDVRCLGRFQSVPDGYLGLTAQIGGNGVPCALADAIVRSLA